MTKAHPVRRAKAQSAVLTNIDKQIEALQAKRTTMMRKRRETIGMLCERAGLHLIDADASAIRRRAERGGATISERGAGSSCGSKAH